METEIEAHQLFEYEFEILEKKELFEISRETSILEKIVEIPVDANGLVFYVNYYFDDKIVSNFHGNGFIPGSYQSIYFVEKSVVKIIYNLLTTTIEIV